jgi:hypothetical protein
MAMRKAVNTASFHSACCRSARGKSELTANALRPSRNARKYKKSRLKGPFRNRSHSAACSSSSYKYQESEPPQIQGPET